MTNQITPHAYITPFSYSYKAAFNFMKVDRIINSTDIFIRNFRRWRAKVDPFDPPPP